MRYRMSRVGMLVGLLGISLGAASCADNEDMIVILGNMQGSPPDCVYQPQANSTVLPRGVMDLAFTSTYIGELLVANQLASRGAKDKLRAETATVIIDTGVVRLLDSTQGEIAYYSVPASGVVPFGVGDQAGYGWAMLDIIPGSVGVGGFVGSYVLAEIQIEGSTLGGRSIRSNQFQYEINIVDSSSPSGGLVTYPASAIDGNHQCTLGNTASGAVPACFIGQDVPIPCYYCTEQSFCLNPP
jgi:hypothetical protein